MKIKINICVLVSMIMPASLIGAPQLGIADTGLAEDRSKVTSPAPSSLESFQDCTDCPAMVNVPAGSFVMGSPQDEPQRSFWTETPQRTATLFSFAIAVTPVTFAQWDVCRLDGGCIYDPDDAGWGRDDRPVINVSWSDAQEYVQWLSSHTGNEYRLPSEAEWEYAARAGTTGRFHVGECIDPTQANFQGGAPATDCPGGEFRRQTLPVASFAPNAWGLHDVHGNVWEWVDDCWNWGYWGAPDDGSAWMEGMCDSAVLRGGSWAMGGRSIRSATRAYAQREQRSRFRGFRVVRVVEVQ